MDAKQLHDGIDALWNERDALRQRVIELEEKQRMYDICMNTGGIAELHNRIKELEALPAQPERKIVGWVNAAELADCRRKDQSVNLWLKKYSSKEDMPLYE